MKPFVLPCLILFAVPSRGLPAEDAVDYNRDVRPILSKNCFACHGQDDTHRAAKLRLDRRDSATAKLRDGKTAVVPGAPERSELVRRVGAADPDVRMPPAETGNRLTPAQAEVLRR